MIYHCLFLLTLIPALAHANLELLEKRVAWDFNHLPYLSSWVEEKDEALEVVIIGGGMAGLAAAYGLERLGIHNIVIFDENPQGLEGPWNSYAHMKVLLTEKYATGPCLFSPSLTFQAWFEAKYGQDEWEELEKATPQQWMEYLGWFKSILNLPVVNECRLQQITPLNANLFRLEFDKGVVFTRKIILATGRLGFGGKEIPSYMHSIPPHLYAHSTDPIDFKGLADKKIAVIGCGASAFDTAGLALESGAAEVDLLFRRDVLPSVHPFNPLAHVGMEQGFHLLSDEKRFHFMAFLHQFGVPPSQESIERVTHFKQFNLRGGTPIETVELEGNQIKINSCFYDYLILATGFRIDKNSIPELKGISEHILLWKDKINLSNKIGEFPYLGPHFQFLESYPGKAPYLRHIYCFNYGALISHGLTSSSIDSLSVGAEKLTKGIAADFFEEGFDEYYNYIYNELYQK